MVCEKKQMMILIVIHAIANITIGVSLLLWTNLSAEGVLHQLGLPWWLWPFMFIAAGLIAVVGLWSRLMAQFAFAFAAIVTSVFGFASLVAVLAGNLSALPTTTFLLYIAVLKLSIALLIKKQDNFVGQVVEATQKGQNVLDSVRDGANS